LSSNKVPAIQSLVPEALRERPRLTEDWRPMAALPVGNTPACWGRIVRSWTPYGYEYVPAAQLLIPEALRVLPPLTEEKYPLAVLSNPPLTEERPPMARLCCPPLTEE
jgi:hypothetical protein